MDRQGERQVLLTLETGRLRISVGNEADTRVRVDSPLGSVSFGEKANVAVGMERHSLEVKVFSTRASVRTQEDQATLGAGEWLRLNSPKDSLNRIRDFNTYDLDDFEKWSGPRLAQRRSPDLDRVPEEIRPYAEELSGNGGLDIRRRDPILLLAPPWRLSGLASLLAGALGQLPRWHDLGE